MKKTILALALVLALSTTALAAKSTTCRVISNYTTQTGQAVMKISCPIVPAEAGDLIKVKKAKPTTAIEGC